MVWKLVTLGHFSVFLVCEGGGFGGSVVRIFGEGKATVPKLVQELLRVEDGDYVRLVGRPLNEAVLSLRRSV